MKLFESDKTFAFLDIGPVNKGHTLVIPKKHYETIWDVPDKVLGTMMVKSKEISKAIEKELEIQTGKKLPINVDGAIAAITSDMNFDWRLGKAFFLLGRVAGLTAQVYEEQTQQKPMREIFSCDCEYNGPDERDVL